MFNIHKPKDCEVRWKVNHFLRQGHQRHSANSQEEVNRFCQEDWRGDGPSLEKHIGVLRWLRAAKRRQKVEQVHHAKPCFSKRFAKETWKEMPSTKQWLIKLKNNPHTYNALSLFLSGNITVTLSAV